jgi:D-alanyl-D-alanine-carboxypeptidase/D-alanyl-D-alanine-endopeptidase
MASRSKMDRRGFLAGLSVAPFIQAGAYAASTSNPNAEIKRLLRFRILKQRRAAGAVLAIRSPSGSRVITVQDPRVDNSVRLGIDTIFEVASLSKIFTDLLLAQAAVRGEVKLDDPLSLYVPPGVTVPRFGGQVITLTDLATHGSGLPRRPDNLNAVAVDAPNKYAGYSLEQLWVDLPSHRLTRAPGSAFEYSNLGVSLLGQALAQRMGLPFAELLRQRITGPLGLADTRFGDDPAAADRRAQGHDVDLKPIGSTDEGALNPAGGLRSTARDLMTFLALFLDGVGPGDLPQAARLMLTVDRPGDDMQTRMALGWRRNLAHNETFYWSNGSGDGSRTFMGFDPVRRMAVVVLADTASAAGLDDLGRRLLDPRQAIDLEIPHWRTVVILSSADLERVSGRYQFAPDDKIEISRGLTGLIVTASGGQFVIYPQSRTRFFAKVGGDLVIDFPMTASGSAQVLMLHQAGKVFTYRRMP